MRSTEELLELIPMSKIVVKTIGVEGSALRWDPLWMMSMLEVALVRGCPYGGYRDWSEPAERR